MAIDPNILAQATQAVAPMSGQNQSEEEKLAAKYASAIANEDTRNAALASAVADNDAAGASYLLGKNARADALNAEGTQPLLNVAASNGNLEIVKQLYAKGAFIDAQGADGDTALQKSVKWGHAEVEDFLLSKGASVKLINNEGANVIHSAAKTNDEHALKSVLDVASNIFDDKGNKLIDAKDNSGSPPLAYAIAKTEKGNPASYTGVEQLLKARANPDIQPDSGTPNLTTTVDKRDEKLVGILLDAQANPNIVAQNSIGPVNDDESFKDVANKPGKVPLMAAAELDPPSLRIADRILSAPGADIEARDADGKTTLMRTAEKNNTVMAEYLLAKGANIDAKVEQEGPDKGKTAIDFAPHRDGEPAQPGSAQFLLKGVKNGSIKPLNHAQDEKAPADVNQKPGPEKESRSPESVSDISSQESSPKDKLYDAVQAGDTNLTAKLLSDAPESINQRYGSLKDTLLMMAAQNDDGKMVNLLVKSGANVNDKEYGTLFTATHQAADAGNLNALGALLEAKPDLTARDATNQTPYDRAANRNDNLMGAAMILAAEMGTQKTMSITAREQPLSMPLSVPQQSGRAGVLPDH